MWQRHPRICSESVVKLKFRNIGKFEINYFRQLLANFDSKLCRGGFIRY